MDDNGGRLFLRIELQTARMGRRLCSAKRRSRSCQHREAFVGLWFEFWLNNKKEKRRVKKRGSIILMGAARLRRRGRRDRPLSLNPLVILGGLAIGGVKMSHSMPSCPICQSDNLLIGRFTMGQYLAGSHLKRRLFYPNNLTANWTYGSRDELLEVNNAITNSSISRYVYTYDAAGRRIGCDKSGSAFTAPDTYAYLYNARSELTNAMATVDTVYRYGYCFDDIGNRETSSERGMNSVYTANQLNQYSAVDDFLPAYDADGNQTLVKTATGIWQVTYNGENRPIRWENGDTVITMSFDRIGRRVTKNDERFVYDGYLQIANNADNTYIWDPTEPVATRPLVWNRNGESGFYTHDGNKNVSEVISPDGSIVAHYEYAPFGAVTSQTGSRASSNPYRFSSEFADDTLGLVSYNYRHYGSMLGRWLGRDPSECLSREVRIPGSMGSGENLYLMIHNDLQIQADILGLTYVVDTDIFPGANKIGDQYWSYVDDGQTGTVRLKRKKKEYLISQLQSATIQLCLYAKEDGFPTREYEGAFDTQFFAGEGVQHQYYLVEGETRIWADNEINYIGIGMYEAWLGSPEWFGGAVVVSWKLLRWGRLPTAGTFYWYSYGYNHFKEYYDALDKCTCQPKDGSKWYYCNTTYSEIRGRNRR